MPGQTYISGGIITGVSGLIDETKSSAMGSIKAIVQFGQEAKRRGSTLPLLRRFSVRPDRGVYETIPMGMEGSRSVTPMGRMASPV